MAASSRPSAFRLQLGASEAGGSKSAPPPGAAASPTIPPQAAKEAFEAAQSGDGNALTRLLATHPGLWKMRDVEFRQPIHIAAHAGNLSMMQLLLKVRALCQPPPRAHTSLKPYQPPHRPGRIRTSTTATAGSHSTLRAMAATPAWPSGSSARAPRWTPFRLRGGSRCTAL